VDHQGAVCRHGEVNIDDMAHEQLICQQQLVSKGIFPFETS
jgi:hypothetical protein